MPAKTGRKGKKKAGGRTVALVKAAFENDNPGAGGGEVDTTGKLSPREAEEKVAQMIGEMKEKGAREAYNRCAPMNDTDECCRFVSCLCRGSCANIAHLA